MTHHTPGPWKVADDGFEIVMDDGDVEARVGCAFFDNTEEDQARADARLIAASPDLLRACKLFLSVIGIMTDGPDDSDKAMAKSKFVEAKKLATEAIRKIDPDGSLYA